ncbi:MAG: [protein-PII] uridylyltransferase, partial [Melioribacteraceae bacterium]|nr:[protein-PII] uridylyltransferase [Melioribacteraceae bacterium]
MKNSIKIKEQFLADRDEVFREHDKHKDAFKFCVRYSLLVEEYVYRILAGRKFNFVIASLGSFSRRELAPFSDIDMMIITKSVEENEAEIKSAVTELWDCGIEVSHTVREFEDIKHFLKEDLHAFTQFFETRYLLGRKDIYGEWNQLLFEQITDKDKFNLINEFFQDTKERYSKYGASPKVLEPNIKFSAGCLRDIHLIEWMYALKNDMLLSEQSESTQTEKFLTHLKMNKVVNSKEITRILEAYKVILNARIYLHKFNDRDNDRLEFSYQEKIANALEIGWQDYMKEFFKSTSNINRFSRTMRKRFEEQISKPISEYLTINLDEDFTLKGKVISINSDKLLSLPEMMRSFYYRGLHDGRFDENLRSLIIESVNEYEETQAEELSSSVFFREILKLPRNVGKTLQTMNELGLLGAFLTQFKDLVGFFQPGVYH